MTETKPTKTSIRGMYVAALESLDTLRTCRPGRCELTAVERASKRTEAAVVVFAFLNAKTKNKNWVEKQDSILAAMGDVV